MSKLILVTSVLLAATETALACAPAPSCWIAEGPAYLRSVCLGYAKDRKTLKQIAEFVDEPEKVAAFGDACKKVNVRLKAK